MRSCSAFETRAWTRVCLVWMVSSALVGLVACGGSGEDGTPDGTSDAGDSGGGDTGTDTTPDSGCVSTCDEDGGFVCDGTTHRLLCRDYNGDGCFETGDRTPCGSGTACEAGVCVNSNTPPTPGVLEFTTPEDTALTVTIEAEDPDAENLRFDVTGLPAHGTISGRVPEITYTPNADFVGTDEIRFTVTDRLSPPVEGRVSITVTAVNDAPQAAGSTLTVNEDSSATFDVPGSDIDGDALTWEVVTQPSHGALEGSGPSYTYTPEPDYFGPDVVQVRVVDVEGVGSDPAAVSLNVLAANDGPVAEEGSGSLDEDDALALQLRGADIDSDMLTYAIASQPTHGAIVGDGAAWTYIPDANFAGSDGFTFTVSDGELTSAPANWRLEVAPVQDAPVVQPLVLQTNEDTDRAITLTATDIDGDELTFSIVSFPEHGELEGSGASWTYRPQGDYFGPDSFDYQVTDGATLPVQATASITVRPVNDVPQGTTAPVSVQQDYAVSFVLTGTDIEGEALQFLLTGLPAHGTLDGTAPSLTYTPDTGFAGGDSIRYRVSDGFGTSNEITLPITVVSNASAPRVLSTDFEGAEDTTIAISLLGEDDDTPVGLLTWTVQTQPAHGILTGEAPALTYLPDENFAGDDSFEVRLSDGSLSSGNVTIGINVSPVNDAPISGFVTFQLDEDTSLDFDLFGVDPDGDDLTWIVTSPPSQGTLTGTGPSRTFTPPRNVSGNFTVGYRISDGVLQSILGLITLEVQPINDAPVIDENTLEFDEDTLGEFVLTATDVEDDAVEFFLVDDSGVPGTVTLSPEGDLTIETDPNFFGEFSLEVGATDGTDSAQVVRFSVIVQPVNDAPTIEPATFTTDEDQAVNLSFIVNDVDGDEVTFQFAQNGDLGSVSDTEGGFAWVPLTNATGTTTFDVSVLDGQANSGPVTMTVIIRPVNDPPTPADDPIAFLGNTPVTYPAGALTANDVDVDGDTLTAVASTITTDGGGTAVVAADGSFAYRPATGWSEDDRFTYTVTDPSGAQQTATVNLGHLYTVWYVDSESTSTDTPDGSLNQPFALVSDAELASATGDTILLRGRETRYLGGLDLSEAQTLTSDLNGLAFTWERGGGSIVIFPEGSGEPTATIEIGSIALPAQATGPGQTIAYGIGLADDCTVSALNILFFDPFGAAIYGDLVDGARISNVNIDGGGYGVLFRSRVSRTEVDDLVARNQQQAGLQVNLYEVFPGGPAAPTGSSLSVSASGFSADGEAFAAGIGVDVRSSAELDLTIADSDFAALGGSGVQILASGAANVSVDVQATGFSNIRATAVDVVASDSAEVRATFGTGSERPACAFIDTLGGIHLNVTSTTRSSVWVDNCSFERATGDGETSSNSAITLAGPIQGDVENSRFQSLALPAVWVLEGAPGISEIRLGNNSFDSLFRDGVRMTMPPGGSTVRMELTNNVFTAVDGVAFRADAGEGISGTSEPAEFDVVLIGNDFGTAPESAQVQVSWFANAPIDGCVAMEFNQMGWYGLLNESSSTLLLEADGADLPSIIAATNEILTPDLVQLFGFTDAPRGTCDRYPVL